MILLSLLLRHAKSIFAQIWLHLTEIALRMSVLLWIEYTLVLVLYLRVHNVHGRILQIILTQALKLIIIVHHIILINELK